MGTKADPAQRSPEDFTPCARRLHRAVTRTSQTVHVLENGNTTMQQLAEQYPCTAPARPALVTELASTPSAVLASQRLRHRVFMEELGARPSGTDPGIDADIHDAFCHHLLVRDADTGAVVASTRILMSEIASIAGGFYSKGEFELGVLETLPGRIMEVGRTCVHPDYRNGSAINALWTGLARIMIERRVRFMMGCASIPFTPEDTSAYGLLADLQARHRAPEAFSVRPLHPVPPSAAITAPSAAPPLLKAYLRLGAWICGEACWDPDFGVADVFILLDVNRIPERYRRHFAGRLDS
jgi:putative hemolysin